MNKELQSLLTNLEKFIYQSENDTFTLDAHQVHLILDHIANQGEEIERLNNIINELEKWLNENLDIQFYGRSSGKIFKQLEILVKIKTLNKLKELKEGK